MKEEKGIRKEDLRIVAENEPASRDLGDFTVSA
jgi:hypothetical protein